MPTTMMHSPVMAPTSVRRPGTLSCLLCRREVMYRNKDTSNFNRHMEKEHGAYFDLDFLLATCFMDEDEKEAVRTVIDAKVVDGSQEPYLQKQNEKRRKWRW